MTEPKLFGMPVVLDASIPRDSLRFVRPEATPAQGVFLLGKVAAGTTLTEQLLQTMVADRLLGGPLVTWMDGWRLTHALDLAASSVLVRRFCSAGRDLPARHPARVVAARRRTGLTRLPHLMRRLSRPN